MTIDAELLEILACPACHAAFLAPAADPTSLTCSGCALVFPVVDGIPVLLVDDAITPDGVSEAGA